MSKVITFCTQFPSYHPKAGQPTFFVEYIYKNLYIQKVIPKELENIFNHDKFINGFSKGHTIRAGNRWKVGDKFSPRIWSGKPYHSKQIIIAPDVEIKKVYNIELCRDEDGLLDCFINGKEISAYFGINELVKNDGLYHEQFIDWFTLSPSFKKEKSFVGQIICWDESINY